MQLQVKDSVSKICAQFPDDYWALRDQDEKYPHELHAALAKDRVMGIALPQELGDAGLGISEATMMLLTVSQSGAGIAGAQSIHANVYATQPVAKCATEEQRSRMLPRLISGEWRACFGVTEPRPATSTGLDTLKLRTRAVRDGDVYRRSGQKIWISSAQVASKCILLARTTPLEEVKKPSEGLSLFFVDIGRDLPGLDLRKIRKMGIGQNQGIQYPLALAYMNLEAAKLATYHGARLYAASGKDSEVATQNSTLQNSLLQKQGMRPVSER
ncbi:MAG: hypothetical protein L6R42_000956 [Xanthoria sp. 1 TBL-2021]|nr:MAG: hypothetical protein L6R42_000956 [Xanthoria sp. 1 TBL-2021]